LGPHFLSTSCCSFSSFVYESKEEKYTSRNLCSNNRAIRTLSKFPPFYYQPFVAPFSSFMIESKEENKITIYGHYAHTYLRTLCMGSANLTNIQNYKYALLRVTIANSLFLVFLLVGQNLILDIYKCPKYRYSRAYKTSKNIVFECVSIMLSF